jgi:hypothetical protein
MFLRRDLLRRHGEVVLRPVPEGHGASVAAFGAQRGVVDGGEVAVPGEEGRAAVD